MCLSHYWISEYASERACVCARFLAPTGEKSWCPSLTKFLFRRRFLLSFPSPFLLATFPSLFLLFICVSFSLSNGDFSLVEINFYPYTHLYSSLFLLAIEGQREKRSAETFRAFLSHSVLLSVCVCVRASPFSVCPKVL